MTILIDNSRWYGVRCPARTSKFTLVVLTFVYSYLMMQALAELAVMYPINGAFTMYICRFIDPSWGFACGWQYGISWLTVLPFEISAACGVSVSLVNIVEPILTYTRLSSTGKMSRTSTTAPGSYRCSLGLLSFSSLESKDMEK